jgi:hypothetical protein
VKEFSYIKEEENEFEGVHMDNGHIGNMKSSLAALEKDDRLP